MARASKRSFHAPPWANYCVYAHVCEELGFVYIGKGSILRAMSSGGRNATWWRTVRECVCYVTILGWYADSREALKAELTAMNIYRPLANRLKRNNQSPSEKYLDRLPANEGERLRSARGIGDSILAVRVSEDFLWSIKYQAAKRGMAMRDFVIESVIKNSSYPELVSREVVPEWLQ